MEIKNLSKIINNQTIIKDINLSIPKGIIFSIIGRNGSGKTTLFRTIASHYQMDSGEIYIDNQDVNKETDLKSEIFYLDTQFQALDNMTPKKIEDYFSLIYPKFDSKKYKILVGQNQLPNQRFQQYSKGMQGLMLIILALCSNSTYIILDEPLDGLDLIVRKQVIDLMVDTISEQNRTIIIASHNLKELEKLVDQVAFLKDKSIVSSFNLEEEKENTQKYQLVFKDELPQFVTQSGKILSQQGRVFTVVFKNFDSELKEKLLEVEPILMEKLPLSLEDLFLTKFSNPLL